jgi:hypothetical protein
MIFVKSDQQYNFYSEDDVKQIWWKVSYQLADKYRICVLQDMGGPEGINCINGKKRLFAANSYGIKVAGNIQQAANQFAFEIAGQPNFLEVKNEYEQKWTHVALFSWQEFWFTESIEKPWTGHRVGVIKAARLNVETSDIYG